LSLIEAAKEAEETKDLVCGMTVDPAKSEIRLEHDGRTFVFCCAGCRAKFAAEPARYLDTVGAVADRASRAHRARLQQQEPVPAGTIFTCPMHPEVRQIGPGACPICGMALEPPSPSAETGPNAELVDMKRRLWFALALAIPVVVLDMGGHLFGVNWLAPQVSNWLQLVLATPVALGAGWPFFLRAAASIRNGAFNIFTLIATGVGVAWLASVVATVAPGILPHAFHTHGGAPPIYFEAAAVITVLVLVGQVLELTARERTGDAIRALLDLQPKRALRIAPDGGEQEVDLDRIAAGDVLRVRPGEKVPATAWLSKARAPSTKR
jgi:Cu+-exporting ATPase